MKRLHDFFVKDELRKDIFLYNQFPIEQATRAFFYKGSTLIQRIDMIIYHFSYLQSILKSNVVKSLYHDEDIELWRDKNEALDWYLVLGSHAGQRKESMMALELHFAGKTLYQMMMWIDKNKNNEASLWIGAMQGPSGDNAKDLVKEATKCAFRYRTKNLILYMTMALARSLQVKHIYAVSNAGYYAMNHIRRNRKLKTDFGSFWEEVGGHLTNDERFYELPLVEVRKTLEEVPTRKRAVYRKRFAFQDDVDWQISTSIEKIKKVNMTMMIK